MLLFFFLVEAPTTEETDVNSLLESLNQRKDDTISIPKCFSSVSYFLVSFFQYGNNQNSCFSLESFGIESKRGSLD